MAEPVTASILPRFWILPVVRAVIALVPGLLTAFIPDHSAGYGLILFGCWATVAGVVSGALALRLLIGVTRSLFVTSGVVTAVAGLLALGLQDAGLAAFLFIVSVWAAVTGATELYAGIRERSRLNRAGRPSGVPRDWIVVGVLTAVLAIVFLALPPNAVVAVGLLGAYLVIIGVYLGIAGLSLKWDGPRGATIDQEEAAA